MMHPLGLAQTHKRGLSEGQLSLRGGLVFSYLFSFHIFAFTLSKGIREVMLQEIVILSRLVFSCDSGPRDRRKPGCPGDSSSRARSALSDLLGALYTSYPSSEVPRLICGTPNQQVPYQMD
jgi:hypothetical protein